MNRNMMLSIDILPVPTDEAVREVESGLLGVETNITNWQRKQNQNNNFSAAIPYDSELVCLVLNLVKKLLHFELPHSFFLLLIVDWFTD